VTWTSAGQMRVDDLRDVNVLVGLEPAELEMTRAALNAAGIRMLRSASTLSEYLASCAHDEPDAAILGFSLGGRPTLELMRAIRRGQNGANRFMPLLMALANPDRRAVQVALKAGAHEVLALPTSVSVVQALLHRSVFVGRPFVEAGNYMGPCRRRKSIPWVQAERRTVWAGYVHASHKLLEHERG